MSIWLAACKSSQLPYLQAQSLPVDSALPMTRIEAKNAACSTNDGDNPELCSCIASELYDFGQRESFKTDILNAVICGTSTNPRQDAISFRRYSAVNICKKIPIPLADDFCWDGSFIDTFNYPCAKCPPEPSP